MPKIMIIDDDPDIVAALKLVLKSKKYYVNTAQNGAEGLRKVREERPDLIILDVMMDAMDEGFNVARELKQEDKYKGIPILMLTAVKNATGLDFKNEAGDELWLPVDDYADKPLNPEDLICKVESLLKKTSG